MVEGYDGRPGAGKTLTMISRAWKRKKMGKRVRANVPLIDYRVRKKRHHFFGPKYTAACSVDTFGKSWADGPVLTTIEECIREDNCLILLDETHMWLPAVEWEKVGFETRRMLAQQRKNGLDFWWTAQNGSDVFNVVRNLTQTLNRVSRYGPYIIMDQCDPKTGTSFGRAYVTVHPSHFGLYDTYFEVGNGSDTAGRRGRNKRGENALPKLVNARTGEVAYETKEPPVHAYYRRVEDEFGGARYVLDHQLVSWWDRVRLGQDAGPHPREQGASSGATPPPRVDFGGSLEDVFRGFQGAE